MPNSADPDETHSVSSGYMLFVYVPFSHAFSLCLLKFSLATLLVDCPFHLGPSINGLVTDGNTKLCCQGFILALFQSTTANKIDSELTKDYKRLLPVCEAEILRVTVKRIEVFSSFLC